MNYPPQPFTADLEGIRLLTPSPARGDAVGGGCSGEGGGAPPPSLLMAYPWLQGCRMTPISFGERLEGGLLAVTIHHLAARRLSPTLLWRALRPPRATCSKKSRLLALPCHARPHCKPSSQGIRGHVGSNLPPAAMSIPTGAIWILASGFSLQRRVGQAGGSSRAGSHPEREGRIFFQAGFARESTTMLPLRRPNPAPRDAKLKAANRAGKTAVGPGRQPFPLGQELEPVRSWDLCWEGWEECRGKQPFPRTIWPNFGCLLPLREQMPLFSTRSCIQGARLPGDFPNVARTAPAPTLRGMGLVGLSCWGGVGTVQALGASQVSHLSWTP